jgi:hypothetical protein
VNASVWTSPWLLLLACGQTACGYAFGSGLPERDIRTVFVEAPGNDTYRQRLEADLGAAVSRLLAASSDVLPASRQDADAVLSLRFVEDAEATLVTGDRTAPVREGALQSGVRVVLTERRSGSVLVDKLVRDRAEFRDPIGEDLSTARAEMVDDLARKIVLALETGF